MAESLAVANCDLPVTEINVFNPQAYAFHETQARAVEKIGHQLMLALHASKQGVCFSAGENNR